MCHNKTEKNLLGSVLVIIFIFSLVSCASLEDSSPFDPVFLTDSAYYTLLPASEIEKPVDGAQQLTATFGRWNFVMEGWVKADESGIDMVIYNSMGAGMGSFSFNNAAVSIDSPVFPQSIKAEYIAADFQFCFYNPQALKRALEKARLVFEISGSNINGAYTEIRKIIAGKETIIEIHKTQNQIRYVNNFRGYSYVLEGAF
jgi:hypothetical protein